MLRATLALILLLSLPRPAAAQYTPPNRVEQALRTGQAFLRAGDRGSAIGWFRQALQRDPNDPRPYALLGEAYRQRNALDDARQVLEAGLVRRPESVDLWLTLARTLRQAGALDRAAAALRSLMRRAPDHLEALQMRAELARERGAWAEALTVTRRLVSDGEALGLSPEQVNEARRFEPALRMLARPMDPVSAPRACEGSPLRRALAGCVP
ncbi:MAG: tetratricopeptide repeat protein [Sandaracinaceae bacterium]